MRRIKNIQIQIRILAMGLLLILGGQVEAQPTEWNFDMSTQNHIIIIQTLASPTVNGKALPLGSWIGVFHEAGEGIMKCSGVVEWKGKSTTVAAWGAEGDFPGFAKGESFKYKVAIPKSGGSTFCIVDDVQVSYQAIDNRLSTLR